MKNLEVNYMELITKAEYYTNCRGAIDESFKKILQPAGELYELLIKAINDKKEKIEFYGEEIKIKYSLYCVYIISLDYQLHMKVSFLEKTFVQRFTKNWLKIMIPYYIIISIISFIILKNCGISSASSSIISAIISYIFIITKWNEE